MNVTLQELAALVHGEIVGDGNMIVQAARPTQEAEAGDITFVENDQHANLLHGCRASAAVVPASFPANGLSIIRVTDPLDAFVTIVRHLHGRVEPSRHGIDARAFVHHTATVGPDASIYPFASVGEGSTVGARCRLYNGAVVGRHCRLGDDVVLYPNAVLYDGTILADRVIVHANAVIGADGFGYRFQNGCHAKVPQLGHVEIGDDVEVGACSTIDRGTFQATRIGAGTKIDNLVQIGHNCRIGRHNLFVSQVGMAGSSSTGDYVIIAGQAGIVDHVHLGERSVIGAKAGVTKDVPSGQRVLGAPATPEREQKRILMTLERLPEIRRDIQRLKQHVHLTDE